MAVALVTGACGGIGRACVRDLGRTHALFLTDIDRGRLETFAETLREEGHTVAGALDGDLAAEEVAARTVAQARAAGPLGAVVHCAGLSPALAGWEAILSANVVATERLLLALEAGLEPGLVAVLLASMAGHVATADAELDALCEAPLTPVFVASAGVRLEALAGSNAAIGLGFMAYNGSKRFVIRTCARRSVAWGVQRARIASVSPGLVWTPMGRKETEDNPSAAMVKDMAPLGRWGRPSDIADAVAFLVSPRASFITGADLRVDGGVTPAMLMAMGQPA